MTTSHKPSLHSRVTGKYSPALALGGNFTAGMLVCVFLGYQIGRRLGHEDAWILGGVFVGLIYGAYEVWKVIRTLQQPDDDESHDADGSA